MQLEPSLEISELFYSLQGESSYAGYPCVFVRLAGCNLRCAYCDARYTYEQQAHRMSLDQIVEHVHAHPGAIVGITGGEPLLQENVYPLMKTLLALNRTVLLETNGSIGISKVPGQVVKILDLKCPGSGMHEEMDFKNMHFLAPHDEVKFVLSSRADYEWAVETIHKYRLDRAARLLFSPVTDRLPASRLADWLLADELPVRLQLQLHKLLWPNKERGC